MDWTVGNLRAKGLIKSKAPIQIRDKEAREEVMGRCTTSESDVVALATYRERSLGCGRGYKTVQSYKILKPRTAGELQTGNSPGCAEATVTCVLKAQAALQ